jgi:hypothetical protein
MTGSTVQEIKNKGIIVMMRTLHFIINHFFLFSDFPDFLDYVSILLLVLPFIQLSILLPVLP